MTVPTPNQYFKYAFYVFKKSGGIYKGEEETSSQGNIVYDYSNATNDNLSQLGDISNDKFRVIS